MKELLIKKEGLNKESVWIGRGGGSFAMTIPLGYVTEGNEPSETIVR